MTPQLFLIAPETAEASALAQSLKEVFEAAPVSALLLMRGDRDDHAYAAFARAIAPVAQSANCALLLQNAPEMVKSTGADGVHITTGAADLKAAIDFLKPDFIVGASGNKSRHDAMVAGETGADYVLFGSLSGDANPKATEDAAWWSETFEVPAVYANPAASIEDINDTGAEFVGLGETIFASQNPVNALDQAARKLGVIE